MQILRCSVCGEPDECPDTFNPKKPVKCRECYAGSRGRAAAPVVAAAPLRAARPAPAPRTFDIDNASEADMDMFYEVMAAIQKWRARTGP